jgi:hypothetical protein
MRGPKAPPGTSDDIDDLIARATDKQNQMNMPAATATAAATSARPAATTSAPPKKP